MPPATSIHLAAAFAAAFVAGGINSVAGGGTMISFPTLIAVGMPALLANATNTVGIWPGSLGSIWGFRRELARVHRHYWWLLIPATIGGAIGAILLRLTPSGVFDWLVPWLVLFATLLFIVQAPVRRRIERYIHHDPLAEHPAHPSGHLAVIGISMQLLVGVYGGYFGAGISIIMLAVLGIMGMSDILEMNAMTSILSGGINGVAGALFIITGLIQWPYIPVMAVGSLLGGYGAAGVARHIGKTAIRRFIIGWGILIALMMFWRVLQK
ncbi:MAG: sulfite exporter TauE/SafE family protein [Phycisphaerae bacterium]|nr:sulfite exporter TauE/SafE family protein [Phycisphaerae bacterium]